MACDDREVVSKQLRRLGWCYGRNDEAGYQYQWHRCEANSLRSRVDQPTKAGRADVPPLDRAGETYELRGIRLGSSLENIRAMRHLDGEPARLFCSGDDEVENEAGLEFSQLRTYRLDPAAKAGTKHCVYYKPAGFRPGLIETGFQVATVGSYISFDFVPGDDNRMLLYRITVRTNVSGWPLLWEGYTGKYGEPTSLSDAPTSNRAGGTFDNINAIWENDVSRITLIKRHERVDNSFVFYEHKALAALVARRLRSLTGVPAKGL